MSSWKPNPKCSVVVLLTTLVKSPTPRLVLSVSVCRALYRFPIKKRSKAVSSLAWHSTVQSTVFPSLTANNIFILTYPRVIRSASMTSLFVRMVLSIWTRVKESASKEFTGKLQHTVLNGEKVTLVDFNRSGVPLVEIVSHPDMNSSAEAKEYLKKIHEIVRAIGVSSADMEKGQMRLEPTVNVMIENESGTHYTPLAEIKNINSFNFASQAIDYEIKRQVEEFEKTGLVKTSTNKTTRGYDSVKKITFLQRSKEEAKDYRYFPDPDIPPFIIEDEVVEKLRSGLPLLPDQEISSLEQLGIGKSDAKILVGGNRAALQIVKGFSQNPDIDIKKLASLVVNGKIDIAGDIASQYQKLTKVGVTDRGELEKVVREIIENNPGVVADYQKGKTNVAGFFVGQAMKATKGTADPKTLSEVVSELLN